MISDASTVFGATSLVVNLDGTQVFSTAVTVPATANAGFSAATGSRNDLRSLATWLVPSTSRLALVRLGRYWFALKHPRSLGCGLGLS
jgi:hypothetical protein